MKEVAKRVEESLDERKYKGTPQHLPLIRLRSLNDEVEKQD